MHGTQHNYSSKRRCYIVMRLMLNSFHFHRGIAHDTLDYLPPDLARGTDKHSDNDVQELRGFLQRIG